MGRGRSGIHQRQGRNRTLVGLVIADNNCLFKGGDMNKVIKAITRTMNVIQDVYGNRPETMIWDADRRYWFGEWKRLDEALAQAKLDEAELIRLRQYRHYVQYHHAELHACATLNFGFTEQAREAIKDAD
jgi:hypothetical protein